MQNTTSFTAEKLGSQAVTLKSKWLKYNASTIPTQIYLYTSAQSSFGDCLQWAHWQSGRTAAELSSEVTIVDSDSTWSYYAALRWMGKVLAGIERLWSVGKTCRLVKWAGTLPPLVFVCVCALLFDVHRSSTEGVSKLVLCSVCYQFSSRSLRSYLPRV